MHSASQLASLRKVNEANQPKPPISTPAEFSRLKYDREMRLQERQEQYRQQMIAQQKVCLPFTWTILWIPTNSETGEPSSSTCRSNSQSAANDERSAWKGVEWLTSQWRPWNAKRCAKWTSKRNGGWRWCQSRPSYAGYTWCTCQWCYGPEPHGNENDASIGDATGCRWSTRNANAGFS